MSHSPGGGSEANQEAKSTTVHVVYDGLTVTLTAAPLTKRIAAYFVDLGTVFLLINFGFFFLVALGLAGVLVFVLFRGTALPSGAGLGAFDFFGVIVAVVFFLIIMTFVFGIYHGYFIYYEYKKGQTPGKKIFGLKVVSTRAARLTLGQCVLRDFFRYIDNLLIFPGLISVSVSQMRQRLGDFASGTVVIYSELQEKAQQFFYLRPDDYFYLKDLLQPKAVPPEFAQRYLGYAFPRFILKEGDPAADPQWVNQISSYFPARTENAVPGSSVEGNVLLPFFAEWCHRSQSNLKD